jgi:hypothetical protein
MESLKNICAWAADKPVVRAPGHYLLGLLMATQRTASGNTGYFLGEISGSGWWYYFPTVFFLKVPLAFHVLALLTFLLVLYKCVKAKLKGIKQWMRSHFTEISMVVFLLIYWFVSINGKLNLGVRHVLPTFPFIYILVSISIAAAIKNSGPKLQKTLIVLLSLLLGWYVASSVTCFPFYLSYFNEIGGG